MTANRNIDNIADIYPLGDVQKGMVFHTLKDPKGGVYHNQMVLGLTERQFDTARFRDALMLMMAKHAILRTGFDLSSFDEPVQIVYKTIEPDLDIEDLRLQGKDSAHRHVNHYLSLDRTRPFMFEDQKPPWRMRLFIMDGDNVCLVWVCHHAIIDGWSNALFLGELQEVYHRLGTEPDYRPLDLKCSYKDFIIQQLAQKKKADVAEFWKKELSGFKRLEFGRSHDRPYHSSQRQSLRLVFHKQDVSRMRSLASQCGSSVRNVCFSAYMLMLSMISYDNDIIAGTVVNNRPMRQDGDLLVGCFLNTIPVRIQVPAHVTYSGFIRLIEEKMVVSKRYDQLPFQEITRLVEDHTSEDNPLFDTLFNYVDYQMYTNAIAAGGNGTKGDGYQADQFIHENVKTNTPMDFHIDFGSQEAIAAMTFAREKVSESTARRLLESFKKIVATFVSNPEEIFKKNNIISSESKRKLLIEFNFTEKEFPRRQTISDCLENTVCHYPDITSVIFGNHYLTYSKLDEMAEKLAASIIGKGIGSAGIVAVVMERSIEMMAGIMGILKSSSAYLPIDPGIPLERIRFMIKDARVNLALGDSRVVDKLADDCDCLDLFQLDWKHIDLLKRPLERSSDDPAYVIYTSGSTGAPKGVMVQHRSVLNRLNWMQSAYPLTTGDVVIQKTPIVFDVSVWELFWWSLIGAAICLLGPGKEKEPHAIISEVERKRVTTIHFVPSMLGGFLEYLDSFSDVRRLFSLKRVFASGEALTVYHVNSFYQLFTKDRVQLINLYGPTEATVDVSFYNCEGAEGADSGGIPIGRPIDNTKLYVLDANMQLQDIAVSGELFIGGEGLARGYLNRVELTADRFVEIPDFLGHTLYRTGDLARVREDGNIEFLGRLDHQVKIRGFRIELGEIEAQLTSVPMIKESVAIVHGNLSEGNAIVAYLVPAAHGGELDLNEIEKRLLEKLPEYMLPSQYVILDELPLLINGKVDRKSLPKPGKTKTPSHYSAPTNELEEALAEIWGKILGLNKGIIGIDDNFFKLGGHSLTLISLLARIHKKLGFRIQMSDVFDYPTIRQFVDRLKFLEQTEFFAISPVEKKDHYKVSAAQKRLYILQQIDPGNTAYHLPQVVALHGRYDYNTIADTFRQLMLRHESLRTSFHSIRGNPVQKIWDSVKLQFENYDFTGDFSHAEKLSEKIREFQQPFDLTVAPLFRVLLIRREEFSYNLLVNMHHIIADGVSLELLIADFKSIFAGDKLPPLKIQYKDYAEWQNKIRSDGGLGSQERYWIETFQDQIPVLQLPYDYKRPAIQNFEGASIEFTVMPKQFARLERLAEVGETTLFMLLLTFINIFLSRLSGQEDIVIGVPVAGRRHVDIESTIGMFVNTIPLRNFPCVQKRFDSFLADVKERTLQAFENQEYPFEDIVDGVDAPRDISRNPLFDVMFTWQELGIPGKRASNDRIPPEDFVDQEFMPQQVKFDMTILSREINGKLWFEFQYAKRLFTRHSIERFVVYFQNILSEVLDNDRLLLGEIDILPADEKRKILSDFNDTGHDFPETMSLWDMIELQANRSADHAAIAFEDQWLTYRELQRRVGVMAGLIEEPGCGSNSIIALLADVSPGMVIAISAVMKAGAAFLPIDTNAPNERVRYLIEDSNASSILCSSAWGRQIGEMSGVPIINIDLACSTNDTSSPKKIKEAGHGLAYVMYTSGSTGNPKGVAVSHRNIVNQLHGLITAHRFDSSYNHMLMAPYTFDPSVQQIFMPLASGGRLTLVPNAMKNDPIKLAAAMVLYKINIFNTVPSVMELLIDANSRDARFESIKSLKLRMIILAGEIFSRELLAKLRICCPGCELINIYGPTEATINTTLYLIPEQDGHDFVSIGKPLPNYRVYVLNESMKPVPINVAGELCVSGEGIARGYLNRPELTAKSFVENPFVPGALLYRTGDLARWREDGNLEFLGRADLQIKIRGMRVEAGEVECVLNRFPGVHEAVVLPEKSPTRGDSLAAYFVPAGDGEPAIQELRTFLREELPEFMIPSRFYKVDQIPLNSNGKIDQKALSKLSSRIDSTENRIPPGNEMEAAVARVWQKILELDDVSVHDNFFDLGGNSLDLVKVSHCLGEELGMPVPVMDLFRYTTIRSLCKYLSEGSLKARIDTNEKRRELLDRAQDTLDDALELFQEDE